MSAAPTIGQAAAPRRHVIVVGAIRGELGDNRIGGQAFACRSLMNSRLARGFDFVGIDSSIDSIKSASGLRRLPSAISRLVQLFGHLVRHRPVSCLLFCSHGLSFIEKGMMTLTARALGARVLLFSRSGHLLAQVERSRAFEGFVRFVLNRASLVLCQSQSWHDYFGELTGGRAKCTVVENWLPDEAFVAADAPVSGSGGPLFVVGYFNRIEPAKGIFDFLEAVALASCQSPNLRAVIYGDGNGVQAMKDRIVERGLGGVVEYRGWLEGARKSTELRQLDTYLFASHVEGFPNSLLELLAMKVPVVSVRVGAVTDVLVDGQSALLVDIGDVEAMAAGLLRLAGDPSLRQQLALRAYARVRELNTIERAVRIMKEALA